MLVDAWGGMLLVKARAWEWKQVEEKLTKVKMYKAEYDLASDKVSITSEDVVVSAKLEDGDNVYAIMFPVAWKHIEPFVTEVGERLKELLERMRPIKVGDHGYELRDYQKEAVAKWLEKKAGIIALPTGAGKTVVAMEIIKRVARRTLVLVPTRVLADQWEERLYNFVNVGKYPRGRDCDVVIATYQSFRHATDFQDFYLVIADEGHHLPAQKWWSIAKYNLFPARLVLSATPEREDRNHKILEWWTLGKVYKRTYSELMEKGYLARLELHVIWVNAKEAYRIQELESLYESLRGTSKKTAKVKWQVRKLLLKDEAKLQAVKYLVEKHRGKKTIIFVPTIEAAKELYKTLAAHKPAVLVGQGREAEFPGALTVEDFRRGTTKVLIATQAGEEGVDIPDATIEIMLDAPNQRQLIQRIGRVARPKPETAKVYFIFAKGSKLDIRNWKKLKLSLYEAGFDIRPQHWEFIPDAGQLTEPNFG